MRIPILTLLLLAAAPAAAQGRPIPSIPQPKVLDWTGAFRLGDQPVNAPPLKDNATSSAPTRPTDLERATAAMAVEDHAANRASYRRSAGSSGTLNVEAPTSTGPVSVGATYGNYRAVPDTGAISARDVRLSLGLAF